VLRGEKSRFQLFGDTVNTASRMESTGLKDRIQVSQETADLLLASEMSKFVKKREHLITAKGKGELQTYWLIGKDESNDDSKTTKPKSMKMSSLESSHNFGDEPLVVVQPASETMIEDKETRLIGWNVEILGRLLKQIVAMRGENKKGTNDDDDTSTREDDLRLETRGETVLDEVQDIIALPPTAAKYSKQPDEIELPWEVSRQLRDFVLNIAAMYRDNPFHNFEHASHVTMSMVS
jgi:Adenylate and Guanylate cyclase catalytic domain